MGRVSMLTLAVVVACCAAAAQEWGEATGPNLVGNPSFEQFEDDVPMA